MCSVEYTSFNGALNVLRSFGVRAILAKVAIESAFCFLPINPDRFNSLAFMSRNEFYFDAFHLVSPYLALIVIFFLLLHWVTMFFFH